MGDLDTEYRFESWFGMEFGDQYVFKPLNSDLAARIRYFHSEYMSDQLHLIAVAPDDLVVGVAALQQNPSDEGELWLQYVSVDPDHRGKGLGRKLFAEAIAHAHEQGRSVELSRFEDDGLLYLSRVTQDLQLEYPGVMTRIPADLMVVDEISEAVENVGPSGR